jgi:DnaJ-class molecular chaperone
MDACEVLEVSPAPSTETITATYHSLLERFASDKNPALRAHAEQKLRDIHAVCEILSDQVKRALYDERLKRQDAVAGEVSLSSCRSPG